VGVASLPGAGEAPPGVRRVVEWMELEEVERDEVVWPVGDGELGFGGGCGDMVLEFVCLCGLWLVWL
jgi:hypothetical protein